MFLERLSESGIKGSKYWYDPTFNKGANTGSGLPNCTCYCVGRVQEEYGADEPLKMFTDRSPGGFPNAKDWWQEWAFDKGAEPKVGGVLVWDGYTSSQSITSYGHVAVCERVEDLGNGSYKVLVSQSAYGGYFFKTAEYTVRQGRKTTGVGYVYLGCLYNPYVVVKAVKRDANKKQVEVLADKMNVRKTPNGEKYEGRFCPKGIYNLLSTKSSGAYEWAKIGSACWIALNDADGWTKTYDLTDSEKVQELEKEVESLKASNEKLTALYNALLETRDRLIKERNSLSDKVEAVRKAVAE